MPCVTLRDTTEWVETVEAGWNVLVDLDVDAALAALERPPPRGERPELYGGGRAGERIRDAVDAYTARPMKIGIVGLGYVGLPLAVAFAEAGHEVVGVDVDAAARRRALDRGESYIEDITSERLRRARRAASSATTALRRPGAGSTR